MTETSDTMIQNKLFFLKVVLLSYLSQQQKVTNIASKTPYSEGTSSHPSDLLEYTVLS
jgi:hypothetical protein